MPQAWLGDEPLELTQSVRSLARQVKPIDSGLLIIFPRAAPNIIEQDPPRPGELSGVISARELSAGQ